MRLAKHCLVILCVIISVFCLSCAPAVWQKVDLAKRQGKLEDAASALEAHLRQHPQDARAHYHLGEIYAQQGEWQKANASFQSSESRDDRWQRETDAARDFFWTNNVNHGLTALEADQLLIATESFRNATTIFAKRSLAHRLLGEASLKMNDVATASSAFEQALQLDDSDHRARRFLMKLYFDTGKYQDAISIADRLGRDYPGDEEVLRVYAYGKDRLNETEDAAVAYQELAALSQTAADFQAYATFEFRQGRFPEAERLSRKAIEMGGDKNINLRAIAQIQLMHQNFEALRNTARELLEAEPANLAALQLLQVAEAALGHPEQLEAISGRIKALEESKRK